MLSAQMLLRGDLGLLGPHAACACDVIFANRSSVAILPQGLVDIFMFFHLYPASNRDYLVVLGDAPLLITSPLPIHTAI